MRQVHLCFGLRFAAPNMSLAKLGRADLTPTPAGFAGNACEIPQLAFYIPPPLLYSSIKGLQD